MTRGMVVHKRPLAVIAVFFMLGIVIARFLPEWVKFIHVFIVSLILILYSFIFSRTDSRFRGNDKKKFNYREYLERQNILALINTRENNITALSHDYKSNHILKYTYLLREKLKNQIIKDMPLESGAFMRAILIGDRSELPKDIQENFKNSGTMHILPTQCRGKYNYTPKSHVTLYKSTS